MDISLIWYQWVLHIWIGQGFTLSLLLGISAVQGRRPNAILGALILLASSLSLSQLMGNQSLGDHIQNIRLMHTRPGNFLFGPLLWFYLQAELGTGKITLKSCFIHGLPSIIMYCLGLLAWLEGEQASSNSFLLLFSQLLHILIYLAACITRVFGFQRTYRDQYSTVQTSDIEFIRHLLMMFTLVVVLAGIRILPEDLYLGIAFSFWFGIGARALFRPSLVDANESYPIAVQPIPNQEPIAEVSDPPPIKRPYERSGFKHEFVERYTVRLHELMSDEKLFRDSTLSLNKLASAIPMGSNHLSQLLNDVMKTSFFDYINDHRIKESMRLLKEEKSLGIIQIAYDVGFNSKSTFYTHFRARVGCTPAAYRDSHTKTL